MTIALDEARPDSGNRALLVQLDFGERDLVARLTELRELALSAGAEILAEVTGSRHYPDAKTFAGKGKVEEIASMVNAMDADLVIFNHELSPAQQRNLERLLSVRVVDRSSLILDIFAQRAVSAEGKLQVELAQLTHLSTRLTRGWTHLERQQGGIGVRGPGETQLETDRRLLGNRMRLLKERLSRLEKQRHTQGRSRQRSQHLNVSLVGYTNAGKSTLFNALTHAGAYAADQLFATLDTTSRKFWMEGAGQIVLSDTVGFIRDLPPALIAAFHATLEATAQADLLLHVVDSASTERDMQIAAVDKVLESIHASKVPQLLIFNKIDCCMGVSAGIDNHDCDTITRLWLSAKTGEGVADLRQVLCEYALQKRAQHENTNAASDAEKIASGSPLST